MGGARLVLGSWGGQRLRRAWQLAGALVLGLLWWPAVWALGCEPVFMGMAAAKGAPLSVLNALGDPPAVPEPVPTEGWVEVAPRDQWQTRWPTHDGSVWYRQHWDLVCGRDANTTQSNAPDRAGAGQPPPNTVSTLSALPSSLTLAMYVQGVNLAASAHVNGELLWRDASLVEPLSRSWFRPRHWRVPNSMLRPGRNEVLIRVVGHADQGAGPGTVLLGDLQAMQARAERNHFMQRTAFMANVLLSCSLGLLFGMVWWMRKQEVAYGWYALMSLLWVLHLATVLAVTPWPFSSGITFVRLSLTLLGLYCASFCLFTWRFGEQHWPKVERALWGFIGAVTLCLWLTPDGRTQTVFLVVWSAFMLLFQLNCVQFLVHAWRRGTPELLLLATCWLSFLLVSLHDVMRALSNPHDLILLAPFSSLLASVFMSLLLAWRLTGTMRRIEGFNTELEAHVEQAREELAHTLLREHRQALKNAKLQERLELAHDLHDGLGGSLVRAMAFVEQTPQPLDNQRVLSLFKVLRDDLRQVIDHGSSANVVVPETPVSWVAPLRHRFTRLFDDMDVGIRWDFPAQWQGGQPSALQCLGMTRVLEEALSNVIKHSRATQVAVTCTQPDAQWLVLTVSDNGVGFDVGAVQSAGLSVGMRSMAARAARMQGQLQVTSQPGQTTLRLTVALPGSQRDPDGTTGSTGPAALTPMGPMTAKDAGGRRAPAS